MNVILKLPFGVRSFILKYFRYKSHVFYVKIKPETKPCCVVPRKKKIINYNLFHFSLVVFSDSKMFR